MIPTSPSSPPTGQSLQPASPTTTPTLYEDAVLAQAAWAHYDGTGIGIAVIDSGLAERNLGGDGIFAYGLSNGADFGARIVYNQSFVHGERWIFSDPYGHGTHVTGILAGNGTNSTGFGFTRTFVGMASNANLINLRVLDENGAGTDSQVIAAIQTAIQLKNIFNIRIINLSLGRGVFENYTQDPLCQAVEEAWKAGIVVVVAAGNDGRNDSAGTSGYGTVNAPGNDPYVITVGAMKPMGTPSRIDDEIASYSSKGPTLFDHIVKPDIVAPGNQVISVLSSFDANTALDRQLRTGLLLFRLRRCTRLQHLLPAERHKHGHTGRLRCCGAYPAAESQDDA